VSEQFLDVAKARSVPEKMGRAGVAEGVNGRVDHGRFRSVLYDAPYLRIGEPSARDRQEQSGRIRDRSFLPASALSPIRSAHKLYSCRRNIFFQPFRGGRRQRNDAFSFAFALADSQSSAVEVAHIQAVKLSVTDAAGV